MIKQRFSSLCKNKVKKALKILLKIYEKAYIYLNLNLIFYKIGLSLETQARMLPYKTYLSNIIDLPIYVSLKDIKWGGKRIKNRAFVISGDWDEGKEDLKNYLNNYIYSKTVIQLFVENKSYKETEQYEEMTGLIEKKQFNDWRTRGCKTEEDIKSYFDCQTRLYREIKHNNYKSQLELNSENPHDEITVYIDRRGELQKRRGAGHHRLAMAYISNIDKVPVIVKGVHMDWVKKCHSIYGKDIVTVINQGLNEISGANELKSVV